MTDPKAIRSVAETYAEMANKQASELSEAKPAPSNHEWAHRLASAAHDASEKAVVSDSAKDHEAAFNAHSKAAKAMKAYGDHAKAKQHQDSADYHSGQM